MILKYLIEIRESQVAVEFFYLCVKLCMRVALVSHGIVVLRRVLERIEIIVLNVSSAQFIRYLVFLNVLCYRLQILNT